jgi:hypothetical protein
MTITIWQPLSGTYSASSYKLPENLEASTFAFLKFDLAHTPMATY